MLPYCPALLCFFQFCSLLLLYCGQINDDDDDDDDDDAGLISNVAEEVATEVAENCRRRLLSFAGPSSRNSREFLYIPYISRHYSYLTTFLRLIEWVFLHSNFSSGLGSVKRIFYGRVRITVVQSHPRSLIFIQIESAYATSY